MKESNMKLTLRTYQEEAVKAMKDDWKYTNKKSIVSLPTGSGKSLVIAKFIEEIEQPTVIIQPSKEILSQNRDKLLQYVDKSEVGTYSASFGKKEVKKYTFATIGSIYKKPQLFTGISTIIIDEVQGYAKEGMFDQFVKRIRDAKVYGLSATPYRNVTDEHYDYRERVIEISTVFKMLTQLSFDDIIYAKNTSELQKEGFLAPLKYETEKTIDTDFEAKSEKKMIDSFEMQKLTVEIDYDTLYALLSLMTETMAM